MPSIGEMDGVWELDPNTPISKYRGEYRERSVYYGVNDSYNFTDRVVFRRDCHILVIGVHDHIRRIHIIEHDLIGYILNRTVMKGMYGL